MHAAFVVDQPRLWGGGPMDICVTGLTFGRRRKELALPSQGAFSSCLPLLSAFDMDMRDDRGLSGDYSTASNNRRNRSPRSDLDRYHLLSHRISSLALIA